ncbi:MAG: formate--tetrahydrofolate ligase, partial [Thermoanaerobaculia bacterium]|nr:formate--tetrahydrofolate ligase [Thermoanaerobaculia bacterium]
PLVALNRFAGDTDEEIDVVRELCREAGVPFAVADIFRKGGEGGREMAERLVEHVEAQDPVEPQVLYPTSATVEEKMGTIARDVYGGSSVTYQPDARQDLERIRHLGYEDLPLCVAKTPASLSDDASRVGRPRDFELTVRRVLMAPAAGYLVPLLGSVLRMPGLGARPALEKIDWVDGEIVGIH